jgi:cytochrome c oxidase subunit II
VLIPAAYALLKIGRVAWMPVDGALNGPVVDRLMWWNLMALTACALAAHVWLAFAMLRRKPAKRSVPAVVRWVLLTGFCAMYAWMALTAQNLWAATRFEGPSLTAMQVEVVGEQFAWYFRYPGPDATFGVTRPQLVNAAAGNPLGIDPRDPNGRDDVVSSVLVLPEGRQVDLRLRSLDVMHGFFIPGMRLKEDAVPGLTLHVHFTPEKLGTYPILCSQVCGLGHDRMQARLMVVSSADYAAWMAKRERAREAGE